jgi:hypothetical protein
MCHWSAFGMISRLPRVGRPRDDQGDLLSELFGDPLSLNLESRRPFRRPYSISRSVKTPNFPRRIASSRQMRSLREPGEIDGNH